MLRFAKTSLAGGVILLLSVIPSLSENAFRFLVWGDATDLLQYVVTNAAQIRQLSVPPQFNLFAGDLYDTGFSLPAVMALRNAMDGEQTNALSGTMFPVRGNHDIIGGTNATTGWQTYFDVARRVAGGDPTKGVPGIGGRNYASMSGCDSLTYSFDYQNSHFVAMDIPGDVTLVTATQLEWLDHDLAGAERRGLQHAFLYWHGPVYSCGDRHGGVNAPNALIAVLNRHPIVSAIFGGHAHVAAWTHLQAQRIASITHSFEAFIVPPVAEGLASLSDTNRSDYGFGDLRGFTTVDVKGTSFTVSFYVQDDPVPRWTRTFSRAARLRSPTLLPDGRFMFLLEGEPGRLYRTESSTDLSVWEEIGTNAIGPKGNTAITNPIPRSMSRQFHRAVPVP
jgi:hypothetical protein